MRSRLGLIACLILLSSTVTAAQQNMSAEYSAVLTTLGQKGDFKDGVLKVNMPRNDLKVVVDGIATPTAFGFGSWIALTKGSGIDVMMGDLVLTEDEINPVMSAVLDAGLDVTALHNHFFHETPRIFFMHVHGHGSPAGLASKIKPALALIGKNPPRSPATSSGRTLDGKLDTAQLAKIVGAAGEQSGSVYKITIGRSDLSMKQMGATINARMGLNTWAAFYGSDSEAVVAGDVAMLDSEVGPVLKALRSNGLSIVSIHHHMTGTQPQVFFLHYWGKGEAQKLARGVRAAVDLLGKRAVAAR